MIEVVEDREVWRLNLELLPTQSSRKSGQRKKKKFVQDNAIQPSDFQDTAFLEI